MIDVQTLEYGFRPFKTGNYLAAFGARLIFENGSIEFVPNRAHFLGNSKLEEIFLNGLLPKILSRLKDHIRLHQWDGATTSVYREETWLYQVEASPNGSHGYLYLTVYLTGFDTFPDTGKWSGRFVPKTGEHVSVKINDMRTGEVLGYYLEEGWIGVILRLLNPPEWYVKQHGVFYPCGLFGTEIRPLNQSHNNN